MWMILLAKYWKECILAGIILIGGVVWAIDEFLDNRKYDKLWNKSARCITELDSCAVDYGELRTELNNQNLAVREWETKAATRAEALEKALLSPPAVVYRDRIVEIPSIVTEPCEAVVVDIADYMAGVLDEN